jgi:putative transposase
MRRSIDAALGQEAWRLALGRRGPVPGWMQHSARGRQDACGAYQERRAAHGMRCSLSRQGDGLENAGVERCLGSFKGEGTALYHYATRQEAREEVIDDLEMCSNSTRLPSSLGSVSPHDCERVAKGA